MGFRLHYAQHYAPEMKGGHFNRDESAWENLYNDRFAENGWHEESIWTYEVEREDLQAYVDEIKKSPEAINEYFTDYNNRLVAEKLDEVLTSDDDTIRIEWY